MRNRLEIFIVLIFILTGNSFSQTIFSNGTGGGEWNNSSTWLGGVVPAVTNDVVISGGDSVLTTIGAVCKSLTVYSNGILATSVDTVYIAETLELESNAYFYNATTNPTLPGSDYILDPESYVVHSGSGTVGGEGNLEFGNLVIQRSAGCVPGGNLLIHGDLIVNNTAYNVVFRGVRPATGSQTHTIEGDVYIYKGILSCIDVGDNNLVGIWNILGNVYVIDDSEPYQESRIGPFSSANAAGLGIFNIGGDLIVQGGRVQGGTSTSAGLGNGIFNLGGNFVLSANSSVATNTLGWIAFNFVGSGGQSVNLGNKFQMSTNVFDTITAASQVIFDFEADTVKWGSSTGGEFVVSGSLEMSGNSFIDGPASFALQSGSTLKIGSPDGISSTGATGNIRVSGTILYNQNANYEYKSIIAQLLGDGLPSTLNGFAVNNLNGIILDRNLNVNQSVNIISGDLDLNGNNIILGPDAVLSETPGNTVTGSTGKIMITKDIGTPSNLNFGGLGAVINSSANFGVTTVERTHNPGTGQGNQGIKRMFNISPANNSGLDAALKFYYDESELNGIPEAELILFHSLDGSNNSWAPKYGSVNTTDNFVELSGINSFSFWTLAGINSSLPVEENNESGVPDEFALMQNFPNPFNAETIITYDIPEQSNVSIKIYDILGNESAVLVNDVKSAGRYRIKFDGSRLSSGIYFCRIFSEKFAQTISMILLK